MPLPIQHRFLAGAAALALIAATGLPAFGQTPATPPPATPAPAAPAPAAPVDPTRVVARVDGEPITEADLATAAEDPALTLPGTDPAQKREVLIGYLIDLKLGAHAANKLKLGDTPAFKRRMAYLYDKMLVDDYLENQTKAAATPEAARKLYEDTIKTMKPEEEVRARHILVADEATAKKAYDRVKGGEDFAKVAAELSTDPGSKAEGGELGFFSREQMVKPFADVAFSLKPGEISQPVKTQFGWHVIQTEEKRTKPVPSFEEMKDQIDQYLARKAQQETVLALRKSGKVERLDKPAAPPAPATPAPGGTAAPGGAPAPATPPK